MRSAWERLCFFVASFGRVTNSGLTRGQERILARQYMRGPGRPPKSSPERTAWLNSIEPQRRPRRDEQ